MSDNKIGGLKGPGPGKDGYVRIRLLDDYTTTYMNS